MNTWNGTHDPEPTKLLVCILTTYERQGWPHKDLMDWLVLQRENRNYAWQHTFAHNFIPAAGARNTIARNFMNCGADWILLVDNDMSPPLNLFDCIKDAPEDAAIVVPKFYLWDESHRNVKLCWGVRDEDLVDHPGAPGRKAFKVEPKFYELTKCGTGAIFIKPEVFQKVPPPWFWYTINEDQNMEATEDINFAKKVTEHGFKIYGNGKITVGHHHTVNLAVLASILYDTKDAEESPSSAPVDGAESLPKSHQNQAEPVSPTGESSAEAVSKSC